MRMSRKQLEARCVKPKDENVLKTTPHVATATKNRHKNPRTTKTMNY